MTERGRKTAGSLASTTAPAVRRPRRPLSGEPVRVQDTPYKPSPDDPTRPDGEPVEPDDFYNYLGRLPYVDDAGLHGWLDHQIDGKLLDRSGKQRWP